MFSAHLNIDLGQSKANISLIFDHHAERATESGCFIKRSWLITTSLCELTDMKA